MYKQLEFTLTYTVRLYLNSEFLTAQLGGFIELRAGCRPSYNTRVAYFAQFEFDVSC